MCIYYLYFHPNVVQRRQIRAKEAAASSRASQMMAADEPRLDGGPAEVTVVDAGRSWKGETIDLYFRDKMLNTP